MSLYLYHLPLRGYYRDVAVGEAPVCSWCVTAGVGRALCMLAEQCVHTLICMWGEHEYDWGRLWIINDVNIAVIPLSQLFVFFSLINEA